MTFEADLRSHVLADGTVSGYVGERMFPVIRKEGTQPPAITYQRIAGVPQTDLDGDDGNLMNIRVQVDVWTKKHDDAKVIAEAIRIRMQTAASTFRSVMIADEDFYEDDTKLFRASMDFSCWYRTS